MRIDLQNTDGSYSPVGANNPLLVGVSVSRINAHTRDNAIDGGKTLATPGGASSILIQALTQNVRYTLDGTAPSTTVGFQLKAGDPPVQLPIGSTETLKVISETAGAEVQYQWLGG